MHFLASHTILMNLTWPISNNLELFVLSCVFCSVTFSPWRWKIDNHVSMNMISPHNILPHMKYVKPSFTTVDDLRLWKQRNHTPEKHWNFEWCTRRGGKNGFRNWLIYSEIVEIEEDRIYDISKVIEYNRQSRVCVSLYMQCTRWSEALSHSVAHTFYTHTHPQHIFNTQPDAMHGNQVKFVENRLDNRHKNAIFTSFICCAKSWWAAEATAFYSSSDW